MRQRGSIYNNYVPAVRSDFDDSIDAYWFVFSNNKILLKEQGNSIGIPLAKRVEDLSVLPVRRQFLGTLHGCPCYSAEVEQDSGIPEGTFFQDLFTIYGLLTEELYLLAGRASQIVKWDQEHQYCSRCGAPTEEMDNERAKRCPVCGLLSYPRLSPAVITAVLKDDKILLAHSRNFPKDLYSIIAGFVEPGENLEECVKREIKEEVGIEVKNIKYLTSQPWPFPNSLMIGFTAEYDSGEIKVDNVEITDAGWFSLHDLPQLPPEMSIARKIIDAWRYNEKT